ncbi:MAG: hypothetical protein HY369_01200 [Candidatus Aenigmarchaeota archaeon]|nr:hypothetical protein [Candidatus Aenigmarchaeota archaeon]
MEQAHYVAVFRDIERSGLGRPAYAAFQDRFPTFAERHGRLDYVQAYGGLSAAAAQRIRGEATAFRGDEVRLRTRLDGLITSTDPSDNGRATAVYLSPTRPLLDRGLVEDILSRRNPSGPAGKKQ